MARTARMALTVELELLVSQIHATMELYEITLIIFLSLSCQIDFKLENIKF